MGVCLGHQAICEAFGATVSYAKTLMHGKQSKLTINNNSPIFKDLPEIIDGGKIPFLSSDLRKLSREELTVIARADEW